MSFRTSFMLGYEWCVLSDGERCNDYLFIDEQKVQRKRVDRGERECAREFEEARSCGSCEDFAPITDLPDGETSIRQAPCETCQEIEGAAAIPAKHPRGMAEVAKLCGATPTRANLRRKRDVWQSSLRGCLACVLCRARALAEAAGTVVIEWPLTNGEQSGSLAPRSGWTCVGVSESPCASPCVYLPAARLLSLLRRHPPPQGFPHAPGPRPPRFILPPPYPTRMSHTPEKGELPTPVSHSGADQEQALWMAPTAILTTAHIMGEVDPRRSTFPLTAYCFMTGFMCVFSYHFTLLLKLTNDSSLCPLPCACL